MLRICRAGSFCLEPEPKPEHSGRFTYSRSRSRQKFARLRIPAWLCRALQSHQMGKVNKPAWNMSETLPSAIISFRWAHFMSRSFKAKLGKIYKLGKTEILGNGVKNGHFMPSEYEKLGYSNILKFIWRFFEIFLLITFPSSQDIQKCKYLRF